MQNKTGFDCPERQSQCTCNKRRTERNESDEFVIDGGLSEMEILLALAIAK